MAGLDVERDFERLRAGATRRFVRRAGRAGQAAFFDLEDLADETYQDAWSALVAQGPPAAAVEDPESYLAGIMWHRFHRRELRAGRAPAAALDEATPAPGASTEVLAEQAALLRRAGEALERLPERERIAAALRAQGLGHQDVAAALGVSVLRARKLCHAANAALASELADDGCERWTSTLRAVHLGWPVSPLRRRRVQRHARDCPSCRATVVALRREADARVLVPWVLPAPSLWERLLALVRPELASGGAGGTVAAKLVAGVAGIGVAAGGAGAVVAQHAHHDVARAAAPVVVAQPPLTRAAGAVDGVAAAGRRAAVVRSRTLAEARGQARSAQRAALLASRRADRAAARARAEATSAGAQAQRAGVQAAAGGRQAAAQAQQGAAQAGRGAAQAQQGAAQAQQGAAQAQQGAAQAQQGAAQAQQGAAQAQQGAASAQQQADAAAQALSGSP